MDHVEYLWRKGIISQIGVISVVLFVTALRVSSAILLSLNLLRKKLWLFVTKCHEATLVGGPCYAISPLNVISGLVESCGLISRSLRIVSNTPLGNAHGID